MIANSWPRAACPARVFKNLPISRAKVGKSISGSSFFRNSDLRRLGDFGFMRAAHKRNSIGYQIFHSYHSQSAVLKPIGVPLLSCLYITMAKEIADFENRCAHVKQP